MNKVCVLAFFLLSAVPLFARAQLGGAAAAGALEGFGKGMADAARQWGEDEAEKQRLQKQLERDRLRFEYEQELIRQRAEADRRNREIDAQRAEKQKAEIAALQAQLARIEAERTKFEEDRAVAKVEAAHPGWIAAIRTPQFSAWKASQPASVQALAASDRAEDAILMLDLYKRDTAAPVPKSAKKTRTSPQ